MNRKKAIAEYRWRCKADHGNGEGSAETAARKVVALTGAGRVRRERSAYRSGGVTGCGRQLQGRGSGSVRTPLPLTRNWCGNFTTGGANWSGKCEPNPAHFALVELERALPNFLLITQNVDGLHGRAGSRKLMEMHGSLWQVRCTVCTHAREDFGELNDLPECPICGHLLRPGVVWFGEPIIPGVLKLAIAQISSADVFLSIGTSSLVQPAASFYQLAKDHGP